MSSPSRVHNEAMARRSRSSVVSKQSRSNNSFAVSTEPDATVTVHDTATKPHSDIRTSSGRKHSKRTSEDDQKTHTSFDGPLAHAEFDRLRRENDSLRKQLHDSKKQVKQQKKMLEEVRAEASRKKEAETELKEAESRHKHNHELLSTIESSILCEVCMDPLLKPFALSPCGHVLCCDCLIQWFRHAPVPPSDLEENHLTAEDLLASRSYTLARTKTCPACRSVVSRRPEPIYVVKTIAGAIARSKAQTGTPVANHHLLEMPVNNAEDPWDGIFPDPNVEIEYASSSGDEEDQYSYGVIASDDSGEEDEEEGDGNSVVYDMAPYSPSLAIGALFIDSDDGEPELGDDYDLEDFSDDDSHVPWEVAMQQLQYPIRSRSPLSDHGEYEWPAWEPPRRDVSRSMRRNLTANELSLYRRGCTLRMIDLFKMEYDHTSGVVAHLASLETGDIVPNPRVPLSQCCRLFMGWNIHLDEEDPDGYEFISEMILNLARYPSGWQVERRFPGMHMLDARRLVLPEDEDDHDRSGTDSEGYDLQVHDEDDDDDDDDHNDDMEW